MKKKITKLLTCVLVVAALCALFCVSASALSWDGSSTGGGGNTTSAGPNGYAIRTDEDNCIGYRFSVVDKNGGTKNGAVIDVFRNTYYGNLEYSSGYKFNTKYNKKQLINNQNAGFGTSRNTTNCYKEANMGFASTMPGASGMKSWQNDGRNLDPILRKLGIAGIASLKNGDKILVEPLYDLRLESVYHAVTVTETAIYGKHILGASSNGGSSWNSGSWGFISSYTNRYYPNELYTPDGQGLWTGVSAIGSSSRATFYTLINSGYGVGIAYTETKPDFTPNLSVNCCEAWPGSVSSRNNNHYGISYGSAFANWTYGHGYPISGDSIWYAVHFPAESQNCYVRQSVWIVGGGSTSRNVWSNDHTWYDVALSPTTVSSSASSYTVKARVDWIDSSGNVLKWGSEKTFYIPIRPVINRYQVSMIDITGNTAAYSGSGGTSGAVYVGQRAYAKYTYTSGNSWTSYNDLWGAMYKWNGEWVRVKSGNTTDVTVSNTGISSSASKVVTSDLSFVRVPDNSGSGSNRIPFKLTTQWHTDGAHTQQSTWIDIPIVKADVAITNTRLIGDDGYYLDATDLEAGDNVTVQYTYKNNSTVKVYVYGYNNDGSQISGMYGIEPGKSINVNGYSFEVPNQRKISIWGGVYLEGAGIYNTDWETNGTNNAMALDCEVNHPLRIYPIAPNASYREGTYVISSFWVQNGFRDDYYPSHKITAHFKVTKADGTIISIYTKPNVVVPGNDKNLVYFKWRVPYGLDYSNITITASILADGEFYNSYSRSYTTIPFTISETPDTHFEYSAPDGFKIPDIPTKEAVKGTWWEYSYTYRGYQKTNYGMAIDNSGTDKLTPITSATAVQNGSVWTMKSGYGVDLKSYEATGNISGYTYPTTSARTSVQYAYALFPEYGYSTETGKYRTLEPRLSYWTIRDNPDYGRVHFTPLWYPDGGYTVKVVKQDCWTPAGMLIVSTLSNTIAIKDSAYDDWFVGQR